MRYIDSWLSGLGLEYIIPKLKANGITTPKKLAMLSLRDMYEVGKSHALWVRAALVSLLFCFDLFTREVSSLILNRFCRNRACFLSHVTIFSSSNFLIVLATSIQISSSVTTFSLRSWMKITLDRMTSLLTDYVSNWILFQSVSKTQKTERSCTFLFKGFKQWV